MKWMRASAGNMRVSVFVDSQFRHEGDPVVVELLSAISETTTRRRILVWGLILHGLAGILEMK